MVYNHSHRSDSPPSLEASKKGQMTVNVVTFVTSGLHCVTTGCEVCRLTSPPRQGACLGGKHAIGLFLNQVPHSRLGN